MFVGMPSGELAKSLKRLRPSMRSRMTSSVQRSPNKSSAQETGQGERRETGGCSLNGRLEAAALGIRHYHFEYLHFKSKLLANNKYFINVSGMPPPPEPQLDAPGAGLPFIELWVARSLFALTRWRGNRATFIAKFEQERAAIRALVDSCPVAQRGERVLITRLPGLEDSSRHWSLWMTLDHLRITNTAFIRVIHALTHGKAPPGKASTAAVKPSELVTAAVEADYERTCDGVLAAITEAADLKTPQRFEHPWFGPLDAFGWAAMACTHMGIHRAQIQSILLGLNR